MCEIRIYMQDNNTVSVEQKEVIQMIGAKEV